MDDFNITSKELAKALGITLDKLDWIFEYFEADPDDDWELIEGLHYVFGAYKDKIFSYQGALEICAYLEAEKKSFVGEFKKILVEWLTGRKKRLKGLCIAKQIEKFNTLGGELVFYNSKPFLSPRACRSILGIGTRQDVLNRTFKEIQTNSNDEIESLKKDHDFYESENQALYFSGSGLASISKQLGVTLTKKYRKDYVKIVSEYAPKALAAIEKQEQKRASRIKAVMKSVKKKANGRCQITNKKQSVYHFDLEIHHLYDQKTYPQYADVEANLIAISSVVHDNFHKWMGGSNVSCTARDMERYIEQFGNSLFEVKQEDGVDQEDDVDQAVKVGMILSKAIALLDKNKE